jgi:hypothetical protein
MVVWSQAEDERLVETVVNYQRRHVDVEYDDLDWDEIAPNITGKTVTQCAVRLERIHAEGNYFAKIDEVWEIQHWESPRNTPVKLENWDACKVEVCRQSAPDFDRLHLPGDTRNRKEFVNTAEGALLNNTLVRPDTVTTVNDVLIPVDIFGMPWEGADKAHLLPKARELSIHWNYPACAVLGFDIASYVDTEIVRKAILGCIDTQPSPSLKIPGIRNLLCNIIRLENQAAQFDKHPNVFIFPIYDIGKTRAWAGEGYEAIVVCATEHVAQRIGMTNVLLGEAKSANIAEINTAVSLASTVCQFLAYSVLQKTERQVNEYQHPGEQAAHARFREEKVIKLPFVLSSLPQKPVFKVSFHGHGEQTLDGNKHPAPDPMLLAFKSCNNWCRKNAGFHMVAGAEPGELDDLSEEGQQNLQDYLVWQADVEKSRQHEDIMNRFGREGAVGDLQPSDS